MKKTWLTAVAVLGLMALSAVAQDVVIPIAKVDGLAVHDAAVMKDAERKAAGVGVLGRVWGYCKDGVSYMASSTAEAVTGHPYLTAVGIAAAVFVDKNNNYTGLWKNGDGSSVSASGNITSSTADNSVRQDNSVRTEINDNSGNITIIVQSPMTDALK